MAYYLVLISPLDSPLYEAQFQTSKTSAIGGTNPSSSSLNPLSAATANFPSWSSFTGGAGVQGQPTGNFSAPNGGGAIGKDPFPAQLLGANGSRPTERHVLQMIAHSSLDIVEEVMVTNGSQYLRNIDKFNEWTVSAFVAPNVKLVLLHSGPNDEGIRAFFMDVWEGYVKVSLNPFHTPNTPIQSPLFENKVRASARKNL